MFKKSTCGLFAIILFVSGCTHHEGLEPLDLVSRQDLSVQERQEELAAKTGEESVEAVVEEAVPATGTA